MQVADRRHQLAGSRRAVDRGYLPAGSHMVAELVGSRKADQNYSCLIDRALRMRKGCCHQAVERHRIRACLGIEGNYSRFS